MAKTDWKNDDIVKAQDMNDIGEEINNLRTDIDNIHIPDASTTQKGIVQLTNDTNSTSETLAPTAKALASINDDGVILKTSASTDFNEYTTSGFFRIDAPTWSGWNNYPTANGIKAYAYGVLEVLNTSGGGLSQMYRAHGNSEVWVRGAYNNNFTESWEKLATQSDVDDLKSSVSNGKNDIASAIIDKGGSASGSDTFGQLATAIRNLKGRVATGRFGGDQGQVTSITRSASGLGFSPRYVFVAAGIVILPANERYFNGLISNFTSLNVGQGKGVSAALASFSPTSDGFTVTVNFANSNGGTTFNASIDYWVAIE